MTTCQNCTNPEQRRLRLRASDARHLQFKTDASAVLAAQFVGSSTIMPPAVPLPSVGIRVLTLRIPLLFLIRLCGSPTMSRWILSCCACLFATSVTKAASPESAAEYLQQALIAASDRQNERAIKLADQAIAAGTTDPTVYYLRGRERLRSQDIAGSLADFDHYIELAPDRRPRLWERGIACYYAGQFQAGADQFAAYQTFDGNDVENAVWHVACLARVSDLATAQRKLLPVRLDRRVPMMEIYDLFRGTGTAEQVLAAAETGEVSPAQRLYHRFYAHLYLGLYYEVANDAERARTHMLQAADDYPNEHYMWDMAKLHADRIRKTESATPNLDRP